MLYNERTEVVLVADNKSIGERIKSKRQELGLTLEEVAGSVGVATSTIQRYEKGHFERLKLPVLEAIAETLGVNPAWLACKVWSKAWSN